VGTYGLRPMVKAHSRPQTRVGAAAKAVAGKKIRWPKGHAGSTPARGTMTLIWLRLYGEPFRRGDAPDIDGFAAAAQLELRQLQIRPCALVVF
jgi:hypothetical protein